jgi:hypothetical protein
MGVYTCLLESEISWGLEMEEYITEQGGAVEWMQLREIFKAVNLFNLLVEEGQDKIAAICAAGTVFSLPSLVLAIMIRDLEVSNELSIFNLLQEGVAGIGVEE